MKSDYGKRLKKLIRLATSLGWTVEKTKGGHLRWQSPSGALVFMPSTHGDSNGFKKDVCRLRKAGLPVEKAS